MMDDSTARRRAFDCPANYRICVRGKIAPAYSDWLAGMSVRPLSGQGEPAITVLEGELTDQAALVGVLNTLYDFQLPLISVEYLGAV